MVRIMGIAGIDRLLGWPATMAGRAFGFGRVKDRAAPVRRRRPCGSLTRLSSPADAPATRTRRFDCPHEGKPPC